MPWTVNPDHGYLEYRDSAGAIGAITNLEGDDGITVNPNGTDTIFVLGDTVPNGTNVQPVYISGDAGAFSETIEVQVGAAITGAPADSNDAGLVSFDDTSFGVDANGYVTLLDSGNGVMTNTGNDAIAVSPDGSGNFNWNGLTVANGLHTRPLWFKDSATANTIDLDVQVTAAITGAPGDKYDAGLASFNDTQFVVDVNGYVSLGGGTDLPSIQTLTGDDAVATGPDANGNIDLTGLVVANATNAKPIYVNGGTNAEVVEVQVAAAITGAPGDTNDAGICSFDDTDFAVDANGYVSLSGTGAVITITGDTGGALSPTGGNFNILGGPGVTTTGSGSTLTINSVVYTDQGSSTSVTSDSGSFSTAAIALTLPASPSQGEICEFVATTSDALTVTAAGTQVIHIGSTASAAGGTAVSNATGDALILRYQSSTDDWWATSVIGTWSVT